MALEKEVTLSNGTEGNYHRISVLRWDDVQKELQVSLSLYTTSGSVGSLTPLAQEVARFRCSGSKFTTYFDRFVLSTEASTNEKDLLQLVYERIKATCIQYAADYAIDPDTATDPEMYVKCDFGNDFYADAVDV
jgi:hypothetical protein